MALRISLRDGEKVIVNGAVLRAVGRMTLDVENGAAVLRGRELMQPDEARTPASRVYFACMMAYIDPEGRAAYQESLVSLIGDLLEALQAPDARACCIRVAQKVACRDFYRALTDCRWLMRYEADAMARLLPEAV
ncbi:flagellar biosynthesis repressor FlbT [Iodidimonas sp. SYSU 1G8]|uniref:flagellar biosynthesis repressor FlbT n=1 Tax=Iodidimonas sp. SYSU 1G8 TaxID=3133967 RepID=UPI0031FE947C